MVKGPNSGTNMWLIALLLPALKGGLFSPTLILVRRAKPSDAASIHSLEFSQPGVGNDGSQYGREEAEAAESVEDGRGQVLIPVQVADEVERQHRCEVNTQDQAVTPLLRPAGTPSDTNETHPDRLQKAKSHKKTTHQ